MNWKLLYSERDEHRVFENEEGHVAIADRSGSTPEHTDDGILWVKRNMVANVDVIHGKVRFTIPVDSQRDLNTYKCCVSFGCYKFLRERVNMDFLLEGDLRDLVRLSKEDSRLVMR